MSPSRSAENGRKARKLKIVSIIEHGTRCGHRDSFCRFVIGNHVKAVWSSVAMDNAVAGRVIDVHATSASKPVTTIPMMADNAPMLRLQSKR